MPVRTSVEHTFTLIMSERKGAYGTTAADTNFRRKWDKDEYAEIARQKEQEEKERMQENEERTRQGMWSVLHYTAI